MRSSKWFLVIGALIAIAPLTETLLLSPASAFRTIERFQSIQFYLTWAGLLLLSLKLLYEELFHVTYYYGYEAEHFVITSGVLLKRRSSLHISLITDVFLERNLLALLFFLYSIRVANPSFENPLEFIVGLSRHNAVGLQDFLTTLIEQTRGGPELGNETGSHDSTHRSTEPANTSSNNEP